MKNDGNQPKIKVKSSQDTINKRLLPKASRETIAVKRLIAWGKRINGVWTFCDMTEIVWH